jgi:hypothetical protein
MKVLALGGYGEFGLPTVELLARSKGISKITIAGRNLAQAQKEAAKIGGNVDAVQLDAADAARLATLLADYDILLNLLSPEADKELRVPVMRAVIHANIHYVDLSGHDGPETSPLELDSLAKESATIAVIGCGITCGIINLMHQHAADQLDESEQLLSGWLAPPFLDINLRNTDPARRGPRADELSAVLGSSASYQDRLSVLRDSLAIEFLIQVINAFQDDLSVTTLSQGQLKQIDPLNQDMEIPGSSAPLRLCATGPMSRRGDFPARTDANCVSLGYSGFAQPLDQLLRAEARRVATTDIALEEAVMRIHAAIEQTPERYFLPPEQFRMLPTLYTKATGRKNGRPAASSVWLPTALFTPSNWLYLTSACLAATVLRIQRGEISEPGVHPIEEVVQWASFSAEYMELLPEPPPDGRRYGESVVY